MMSEASICGGMSVCVCGVGWADNIWYSSWVTGGTQGDPWLACW